MTIKIGRKSSNRITERDLKKFKEYLKIQKEEGDNAPAYILEFINKFPSEIFKKNFLILRSKKDTETLRFDTFNTFNDCSQVIKITKFAFDEWVREYKERKKLKRLRAENIQHLADFRASELCKALGGTSYSFYIFED